jgi:hypothetical protein
MQAEFKDKKNFISHIMLINRLTCLTAGERNTQTRWVLI